MSNFLEQMAKSSAQRVNVAKKQTSSAELFEHCQQLAPPLPLLVKAGTFGVIAEIKVRSPAEGVLADTMSIEQLQDRARQYIAGGACALSVLTEPDRFDGHLSYLTAVSDIARDEDVAVMRKDFLVDPYQLLEARAAGADGVLLIARILDDEQLQAMLAMAASLQLFVLLEAFDQHDLIRCASVASDQVVLGLNCRDLSTLKIDPKRFGDFVSAFPQNSTKVAESGIATADDAQAIAKLGYNVALIGTALMKTNDPAQLIGDIIRLGSKALVPRALESK